MTTPARAARERALARIAATKAGAKIAPLESSNAYALMLARLDADMRRLHKVQSVEKKIEMKREMLPEYAAWVDGALAAQAPAQDDVLMNVLVWRIDVGDHAGAIEIAAHALRHGLVLPERYKRALPCLLVDEFADQALRALVEKRAPDTAALLEVDRLTLDADMPDEARAKLNKAIGLALEREGRPAEALTRLQRAYTLHDGVGVKKDIERLARALARNPGEAKAPPPPGDNPPPTAGSRD